MKRPTQGHPVNVRFDDKTIKKLEKRGQQKAGLKVTSYVRQLVLTHPEMKGE